MSSARSSAWLGIDLGTTKTAAVVLDGRTRAALAVERTPTPGRLAAPPGRSEWDAPRLLEAALAVGARAVRAAGSPAVGGLGVSCQMHGVVLVEPASLRPVSPFYGWQDQRALEALPGERAGLSALAEMEARLPPTGARRTGCRMAPGYGAATLYWLVRTGALPAGARAASIGDFLVARLCGRPPPTDASNAAAFGVLDVAARAWDGEALGALGLRRDLLPAVCAPGAVAGALGQEGARALGLIAGTPVVAATGDNQAGVLGSLTDPWAEALVNVGTGAQLSAVVRGVPDPALLLRHPAVEVRPYLGETTLLAGARTTGGSAYALVASFVRAAGRIAAGGAGEEDESLYATLGRLAEAVPAGCDGLRCDPDFFGERGAPDRRGALTGITPQTLTPGHLARATLEGVAAALGGLYRELVGLGGGRQRVVGAGNALRRNRLLAALVEEALGVPLRLSPHDEAAARGAALLALAGAQGALHALLGAAAEAQEHP